MLGSRRSLIGAALVAVLAPLCRGANSPGVFEVDLVFPNNSTYAPAPVIPIVFGVQNAGHAAALQPQINWEVYQVGPANKTLNGPGADSGKIELSTLNSSSADPYLSPAWITTISGIDSSWIFTWTLTVNSCGNGSSTARSSIFHDAIVFTTSSGASAPDLVSATSANTCHAEQYFALNVTAYTTAENTPCAVLASQPTVSGSPCAVSIGSAAASSILAEATAAVCESSVHPTINCSASKTTPSANASGGWHVEATGSVTVLLMALMAVFLL